MDKLISLSFGTKINDLIFFFTIKFKPSKESNTWYMRGMWELLLLYEPPKSHYISLYKQKTLAVLSYIIINFYKKLECFNEI